MGAARFAAAAQARGRVDETLGLERSRRKNARLAMSASRPFIPQFQT